MPPTPCFDVICDNARTISDIDLSGVRALPGSQLLSICTQANLSLQGQNLSLDNFTIASSSNTPLSCHPRSHPRLRETLKLSTTSSRKSSPMYAESGLATEHATNDLRSKLLSRGAPSSLPATRWQRSGRSIQRLFSCAASSTSARRL